MKKENQLDSIDFEQIARMIVDARNRAFYKVNEELVLLYFNVGKILAEKVSQGNWGDKTVDELAKYIETKLPEMRGFNRRGLFRMKQFYETYSNPELVSTLLTLIENPNQNKIVSPVVTLLQQSNNKDNIIVSPLVTLLQTEEQLLNKFVSGLLAQVSWTNHLLIMSKAKSLEEKLFYLNQSITEKLSKRELERQLNSAVYERTMLSVKTVSALPTQFPSELFKDPYIFEFLDLPEGHSEKDLEKAIIKNLQKFILEIGKGFTYMGNQFRLQVGNKDYHTDLLFYHRDLQSLVMFELKIQEFEPEFLGKLNFYLEALDRDVKRPHENASIGILLCKGKDNEVVEYSMARNTSPAMIADYETKLIPRNVLANKLHQLVEQLSKNEIE
jgi:predicted nuclease of restriction endonuclease-like (RecB) superfamily